MALNIPMPQLPGQALLKGLDTGSSMYQRIMQGNLQQQRLAQQKELAEQRMAQQAEQFKQKQNMMSQLQPRASGDVANALVVENLRARYGDNDPRYLNAKEQMEQQKAYRESQISYRDQLARTLPHRALSPTGKLLKESAGEGPFQQGQQMQQAGQQGVDGARQALDPARQRIYQGALDKKTTDADSRKRMRFAENIDKTIDNINIDDLVQYSGLKGTADFAKDQLSSIIGKPPERFIKHKNSLNSTKLLVDQMRQFYGDSIQPLAMQRLEGLVNPQTWYENPKVAKKQVQQIYKILKQEEDTYKKAGSTPISMDTPTIGYKDGEFVALRPETNLQKANTKNNMQDETLDWNLDKESQKLIAFIPEATPENIRHTAKEQGISIQEVIEQLKQLSTGG